jgi:hypothetical protein
MDVAMLRQQLREDFECEADWRRQKAAEYPEDERNLRAAESYDQIAATIDFVPDELIIAYGELFEDETEAELFQELLKELFYAGGAAPSATDFVQHFMSRVTLGVDPRR